MLNFNYCEQHIREFYRSLDAPNKGVYFSEVGENKVLETPNKLNPSKATGLDNLSSIFVKDGAKFIASPLTHILNLSLSSREVPDDLTSARVMPVYKKRTVNWKPTTIGQSLFSFVNTISI